MTLQIRRGIVTSLLIGLLALFIFVLNPLMVIPRLKTWIALFLILEFFILAYAHKHKKKWLTYIIPTLVTLTGLIIGVIGLIQSLQNGTLGSGLGFMIGLSLMGIGLLIFVLQFRLAMLSNPNYKSNMQTRAQATFETLYITLWMVVVLSSHMWIIHFQDQMMERMMLMISISLVVLVGIYIVLVKGLKKKLDPTMLALIAFGFFTIFYALIGNSESSATMMLGSTVMSTMLFVFKPEIKGDIKRVKH